MKAINNTASARNLIGILVSLSIGFALILFSAPVSKAHNAHRTPPSVNPMRIKVQQIYTSQIGVREKGLNTGPEVEKYLRYVNLSKGNPWCAAFVCWVLGEARVSNPRSGWSPDLFPAHKVIWSRGESGKGKGESVRRFAYTSSQTSNFPLLTSNEAPISLNRPTPTSDFRPPTSDPQPMATDVFGLYFPEKGRISHVGFIDHWDGTWMISVEGNTNLSGSREGDGVYRKRRLVRTISKVARYVDGE